MLKKHFWTVLIILLIIRIIVSLNRNRCNYSDIMLTERTDCTDFFATCFSTTEMTDLTDFVSIACSLRYLSVMYPLAMMLP